MKMDNQEFEMTTPCTNKDSTHDNSDLLSLLNNIEQLFAASRIVINSHSAAAILLSLTFEVQTLLTKLRAMRLRWMVHLPFKEACTVDFVFWSNRIKQLAVTIKTADNRQCLIPNLATPSSHYLLDLYEQTARTTSDGSANNEKADPKQMLQYHAAMQDELTTKREECINAISQLISNVLTDRLNLDFTAFSDISAVRGFCSALLTELSDELFLLHEQQVKIFTKKEYERLAERILYEAEYEGPTARREARDIMHNWRNGVPEGKLDESRKAQIEQTKEEIRKTKHGVKLEQYVNLDADFYSQRSEFGRFLFNRRRDITRAEVRELILLVYCVYYYQKDAQHEADIQIGEQESLDAIASEDNPVLPTDFQQSLRDSQDATKLFYKILRRVEPYINKGNTTSADSKYKGWTWCYLKTAFEQLDFLPKNSSQSAFSTFISTLFSHRTIGSVTRALQRNTNPNSPNIVADIVKEFQPVHSLIKK